MPRTSAIQSTMTLQRLIRHIANGPAETNDFGWMRALRDVQPIFPLPLLILLLSSMCSAFQESAKCIYTRHFRLNLLRSILYCATGSVYLFWIAARRQTLFHSHYLRQTIARTRTFHQHIFCPHFKCYFNDGYAYEWLSGISLWKQNI